MQSLTILLAEDEPIISMEIRQILEDQGHQVIQANTMNDLKEACVQYNPSLVMLNFRPKENGDGMTVAQYLKNRFRVPIMLITGASPQEIKATRFFDPSFDILYKPFAPSQLRHSVHRWAC